MVGGGQTWLPAPGRNRGGRGGHDALIGTPVRIRKGPFKGHKGRVADVKGQTVRVEMDASMKILTGKFYRLSRPFYVHGYPISSSFALRAVDREHLSDNVNVSTPYRAPGENANPPSWGSSPQYQPGRPPSRTYDAPTHGGEAGTPRDISPAYVIAPRPYLPSTPGGQPPMTPSSAYLPGTPGGQPMTPGSGGLDIMSTVVGGDSEGPWFLPDILVNVRRSGEETAIGVVREVLPDGSCRVALGSSGNGETVTSLPNEIEIVVPRRSDKIKIMGGAQRGATGKLIRVDGMDGIVKVDDMLVVKILDMAILAKLAQP
ncbi:hypothetical protein RJ639_037163 [Escallonia herrerae]|uniref:KOW domain-containing protein n=1 Tax=Escallonia herrerae TaxID=1293975 RepID=A0AA88WQU7_9ASTE|nr:hypothetical protein RJ639_037163 [Escallonia herrerae]